MMYMKINNLSKIMRKSIISLILILLGCISTYGQTNTKTLHLFSDEMKTQYPSVVYDFLERYLAEVSNETPGYQLNRKMSDDKVTIIAGQLSNVSAITPETPFTMSKIDDKYYDVCWLDTNNKILLNLTFPIQYELLLGMNKKDIEQNLREMIIECSDVYIDTTTVEVEKTEDGYYSSIPSTYYYIPSLNTSSFYYSEDSMEYEPIFSDSLKSYSAANLMQGVIGNKSKHRMYIQQNMYNRRTSNYTVSLASWLNYCKANGMTIYFAVEEERADGLKCLIIAESKSLGFNHLLSVIIPDDFVTNVNSVIKAKMNAFIPTQNVKDLYQKYTSKRRANRI